MSKFDTFMDQLLAAGVTPQCMWATKAHPEAKYDDVLLYRTRTEDGKQANPVFIIQKYTGHASRHDTDHGYELYIPSNTNKIEDDVALLSKKRDEPEPNPDEVTIVETMIVGELVAALEAVIDKPRKHLPKCTCALCHAEKVLAKAYAARASNQRRELMDHKRFSELLRQEADANTELGSTYAEDGAYEECRSCRITARILRSIANAHEAMDSSHAG